MTNAKNTKRALVSSLLALVLCITMLIGSTYAWFTDSAVSGSNIIQSGTLDVALVDANGDSLEGQMIEWDAFDGRAQEKIFWEPNCTYNTEEFYVVNNGNLNLKFKIALADVTGDTKLLEVIDFTAMTEGEVTVECPWGWYTTTESIDILNGGTIDMAIFGETKVDEFILEPGEKFGPIVMTGHMDKNAGNEYQGLTLENVAINVLATQVEGEEDSYDAMYDASTTINYVGTEEELIEAVTKDGVIALTDDIALHDILNVTGTVTLDLAGHTLSDDDDYTFNNNGLKGRDALICVKYGAGFTINDSVGTGAIIADSQWMCGIKLTNVNDVYDGEPAKLVINGGTITSATWYAVVGNGSRDNTEVTINGGNLTGGYAAVHNPQNGKLTINGGKLTGVAWEDTPESGSAVIVYSGSLYINGGEFNGNNTVVEIQNKNSGGYEPIEEIAIKGGVYNSTNVYTMDENGNEAIGNLSDFVSEDYHVVANGDKYQVVSENVDAIVSSATELTDALSNGADNVVVGAGTYTVPSAVAGKDITITGSGDSTVFDFTKVNSVSGASIKFENLKITGKNANVMNGYGIQSTTGDIVYKNCTFENAVTNEYYGNVSYIDCKFTGTFYIATYSVKSATFENCIFDRTDSRAILVYSHGNNPVKVTVKGCDFKAAAKGYTGVPEWTAAVEVDTTNISSAGTTVTIEGCTYDANYNGIVRDKSTSGKENSVITVNNTVVDNTTIKTTGYAG